MKQLYFLAFAILLFSCVNNRNDSPETIQEQFTKLSGHIENYNDSCPKNISILVDDIALGKRRVLVQDIDSNGNFVFDNIGLYLPQDFYISYKKQLSTILLDPGDSISVNFNPEDIKSSISFEGDQALVNQIVSKFRSVFSSYLRKHGSAEGVRGLDANSYKQLVYKQQLKYDSLTIDFISANNPPQIAEDYIRTYVKAFGGALLLQPFFNPDMVIPNDYWDFNIKDPFQMTDHFIGMEYIHFLTTYSTSYYLMHDGFEQIRAYYQKMDYVSFLKAFSDSITNKYQGLSRDILITQVYYKVLNKDLHLVDSLLNANLIYISSEIIEQRIKYEITLIKNASSIQANEIEITSAYKNKEEEFLAALIKDKFPGKVVYVDFWATWCSPCRAEIPYSKLLHGKLHDKDIVFLNICCKSKREIWQQTIKELEIDGEHIFLDDDQYAELQAKYQIQGFPTYLIFNSKGELVNMNAPRPSSDEIETILSKLLAN